MTRGETDFKEIYTRLIAREMEISLERVSERLKKKLGYLIVEGRGHCGHGRSLDSRRTAKGARVGIAPFAYLSSLISCYRPPPDVPDRRLAFFASVLRSKSQ